MVEATRAVVLIVEPSFEAEETISYFESYDKGEAQYTIRVATRPTWTEHKPRTEHVWERRLSLREAKRVTTRLNRLTISGPPHGKYHMKDGTTYQLIVSDGSDTMELKWWEDLPEGWNSVWGLVRVMQGLANYKIEPRWWQIWR